MQTLLLRGKEGSTPVSRLAPTLESAEQTLPRPRATTDPATLPEADALDLTLSIARERPSCSQP